MAGSLSHGLTLSPSGSVDPRVYHPSMKLISIAGVLMLLMMFFGMLFVMIGQGNDGRFWFQGEDTEESLNDIYEICEDESSSLVIFEYFQINIDPLELRQCLRREAVIVSSHGEGTINAFDIPTEFKEILIDVKRHEIAEAKKELELRIAANPPTFPEGEVILFVNDWILSNQPKLPGEPAPKSEAQKAEEIARRVANVTKFVDNMSSGSTDFKEMFLARLIEEIVEEAEVPHEEYLEEWYGSKTFKWDSNEAWRHGPEQPTWNSLCVLDPVEVAIYNGEYWEFGEGRKPGFFIEEEKYIYIDIDPRCGQSWQFRAPPKLSDEPAPDIEATVEESVATAVAKTQVVATPDVQTFAEGEAVALVLEMMRTHKLEFCNELSQAVTDKNIPLPAEYIGNGKWEVSGGARSSWFVYEASRTVETVKGLC
jgi:hypothetical protein